MKAMAEVQQISSLLVDRVHEKRRAGLQALCGQEPPNPALTTTLYPRANLGSVQQSESQSTIL